MNLPSIFHGEIIVLESHGLLTVTIFFRIFWLDA